jgi:very-short-patch-repair endonuclease
LLVSAQFGIADRDELIVIGITPRMIDRRVQAGRLHVIHRGVYAVGHTRLSREARWLAAVKACGEGAVLSHRSAAALWGLRRHDGRPEITTRHAHRRGRLLVARRSVLGADEITVHRAIPTTTPERTLIDLGTVLRPHQLDRAVREAEYLRLVDFAELARLLDRHRGRRGTAHLRSAIAAAAKSMAATRSDLEDRFRTLVLAANLPTPLFNQTLDLNATTTIEVDVVWPDHKVIVELDGYAAHATRDAFVRDRRRDRAALAAGFVVMRFTSVDTDGSAIAELQRLLSARTPRRSGRLRSFVRLG